MNKYQVETPSDVTEVEANSVHVDDEQILWFYETQVGEAPKFKAAFRDWLNVIEVSSEGQE